MMIAESKIGGDQFWLDTDHEDDAWDMLFNYIQRLAGFVRIREELIKRDGWRFIRPGPVGMNFPNCKTVITRHGSAETYEEWNRPFREKRVQELYLTRGWNHGT